MKTHAIILLLLLLISSCKDTGTGPSTVGNLISNSTFVQNGVPSLSGWIVPDTSAVHFSTNIPQGGSGYSIVFQAQHYVPWWFGNSIYATITIPSGRHQYRLSTFAKGTGITGRLFVFKNRPPGETSPIELMSLGVLDSVWSSYSVSDTISTRESDTLFVTIFGGGTESRGGTTYFNRCKFEKLD